MRIEDKGGKEKQRHKTKDSVLLFPPRPDWHAAELPNGVNTNFTTLPPKRSIDELQRYANELLEVEREVSAM